MSAILDYLNTQFPVTVGHIPLVEKLEAMENELTALRTQNAALKAEIESIGDEHRWTRSKTLAENVRELTVNKEALRVELLETLHKNAALREIAKIAEKEMCSSSSDTQRRFVLALANAKEKGAM